MKNTPFLFYLTWFIFPFCFAGYYDFSCAPFSIILLFNLVYLIYKKRKLTLDQSFSFLFLGILTIAYLIVCIWAVDRNMTFLAFFRYLFVFLFILNFLQYNNKEQEKLFKIIPLSALTLTIVGLIAYYMPSSIKSIFYSEYSCLYGSFLYKNTYALFLLISIIIILYFHKNWIFTISANLILLLGIYRSSCKSIMIITGIVFLIVLYFLIVKRYTQKIALLTALIISICSIIILVILNGKYSIFNKLVSYLVNSHSLNERILFNYDAFKLLLKNPLGLGMYAFYYTQPSMQSGYYYSINVHNDFLQMGLETGIIVLILFILVIIKSLFSKNTNLLKKSILLLVSIHSLFDFDLQFMVILTILAMCFDYNKIKIYEIKYLACYYCTASIIIITNIYISIAGIFLYLHDYSTTLKLYPNTSAQVILLASTLEQKKGYEFATSILSHNSYIFEADLALAKIYAENNYWEEATTYMEEALSLNPRVMRYYEYYADIYYNAALYYQEKGDENKTILYCKKILTLPDRINNLLERTLPYAYKSMWNQDFNLTKQTQLYLKQAEELQKNILN